MQRVPRTVLFVGLVLLMITGCALGRETENQLLQRIQNEHNPIKKAKAEIKLANFKLSQAHDEYLAGHTAAGAKLLGAFMDDTKACWKLLRESGRNAAKQSDGFQQLEIALRENARLLNDLQHDVNYFDRAPLTDTEQQLDQMRSDVLRLMFLAGTPRGHKSPPPQNAVNPGGTTHVQ